MSDRLRPQHICRQDIRGNNAEARLVVGRLAGVRHGKGCRQLKVLRVGIYQRKVIAESVLIVGNLAGAVRRNADAAGGIGNIHSRGIFMVRAVGIAVACAVCLLYRHGAADG